MDGSCVVHFLAHLVGCVFHGAYSAELADNHVALCVVESDAGHFVFNSVDALGAFGLDAGEYVDDESIICFIYIRYRLVLVVVEDVLYYITAVFDVGETLGVGIEFSNAGNEFLSLDARVDGSDYAKNKISLNR